MTTKTETPHAGEFLVSEAEGTRSRRAITVLADQVLKAGAIIGFLLGATALAGANTGNGAMGAITVGAQVEKGAYVLKITEAQTGLGAATPAAAAGNTGGSGTIGAVTVGAAKKGVYKVVCIEPASNAGKFTVEDPDGITVGVATVAVEFVGGGLTFTIADATDFVAGDSFTITVAGGNNGAFSLKTPSGYYLPNGAVGAAYTSDHLNFTLADGATDFIVGDTFTITVAEGKVKAFNPANTDGSQVAAGILFDAVDATGADKPGVAFVRDIEFNEDEVTWFSGATTDQKTAGKAQLAKLGIIAR